MPEEKQEQKKRGIAKRILKKLDLIIFSLLLIAAIYFQAPWKVITLLFILFLAPIALPRPYRKWFWLSVAAVIIALIVWVFLPDETEGWRPYTFNKELAALEAKYAVPDSENAAFIYNQAFETLGSDANEPNFFSDSRRQFWNKKDHPETAQWLREHKGTIEKLMQASKVEKCYFPIGADPMSLNLSIDRLAPMRRCAYLLISSANNNIAEGKTDIGLEKYLAIMKMADHMRQQSTMIETLAGIGIESLALGQLKTFAVTGDATERHLSVIEDALAGIKYDWSGDLPRFLEYEKLLAKNLWGMFYAVNPEGKVKLNLGITVRAIMAQLPENMKNEIMLTYWRRKLVKATTILTWLYMPSTPQKAGKIIDASYEKLYAGNFASREEPKEFSVMSLRFNFRFMIEKMLNIMAPVCERVHDTYLRAMADKRGSQIIIALRHYKNKYSHWPESLGDIKTLVPAEVFVDPINGGSFIYKLTDDNFTLYSKGKNNIDEDGQNNSTWDPNTHQHIVEQDDFLLWPNKKCNTQPQDSNSE